MPHREAVHAEYARLAPVYERRWRHYLDASAAHSIAALAPQPGERILDAGCGSGVLLRRIAEHAPGADLVGIDISPEMLARASARRPPHATLERGDVRRLPFADGTFDAVVIASVLHYVADAEAALGEAARVLRESGRMVVTDWCGDTWTMRLLAWLLNRRRGAPVHLRREHALYALLEHAGFSVTQNERYAAGFPWRLVTVAATKRGGTQT